MNMLLTIAVIWLAPSAIFVLLRLKAADARDARDAAGQRQ